MGVSNASSQTVKASTSIYASIGRSEHSRNSQGGVPVDNIGRIIGIELKDYRERRPGKQIEEEIRAEDREHCRRQRRSARAAAAARRPARTS